MKHKIIAILLYILCTFTIIASIAGSEATHSSSIDLLIGFDDVDFLKSIEEYNWEVIREFTFIDAVLVRMPRDSTYFLATKSSIRYIEEDQHVFALNQSVPWGIDRVFGEEEYIFPTWNYTQGNGLSVAVLDTGVDEFHQDLPSLLGGINTIDNTHWGLDEHGHGTAIAGVIAAMDNNLGVVGVAPEIHLYSVKVLNKYGTGRVSSVIAGIEWAVEQNIAILNMSLGLSSNSTALEEACNTAYSAGHLLVAAAGNKGESGSYGNNVLYPASYCSVIAVSASNSQDLLTSWSSTGDEVELIAPGDAILSTSPENNYTSSSGTSLSAPHVAGVAALIWALDPGMSNIKVRNTLNITAEDLGLDSLQQGYGLIRADRAVMEILGDAPEVHRIVISGSETLTIPKEGVLKELYTAIVYDQYDKEMPEEGITWSIAGEVTGVYITEAGEITVTKEVIEEKITVVATSISDESVYGEKTILLERVSSLCDPFDLTIQVWDLAGDAFVSPAYVIITFVSTSEPPLEKIFDLGLVKFDDAHGIKSWTVGTGEENDLILQDLKTTDINEITVQINTVQDTLTGLNP